MTAPKDPYFARVIANRVWAEPICWGMVDLVDDLRVTNPPSNEPLLAALFRRYGHNLKHLIRTILGSPVHGLSSTPNERNVVGGRNFSPRCRRRLRAEVLLDAVRDMTGVSESFEAASDRLAVCRRTSEVGSQTGRVQGPVPRLSQRRHVDRLHSFRIRCPTVC